MWRSLFTLILAVSLTACGFHPRGTVQVAPELQRVYLKTQSPYSDLTHNIRQYLKTSGVYLADSPYDATTVLEILSEDTQQQLLGVSGSQQTRQYNLTLIVKFQLTKPNGVVLLAPESLSETRTLPINSNEILSGSNQADALYQQMRRAIVFDIMNRLSSQYVTGILHKKPGKS